MLSSFPRNITCNGTIGKYCEDFNNKTWPWSLRYESRLLCKISELHHSKAVHLSFWSAPLLCNFVHLERSRSETLDLGRYGGNKIKETNLYPFLWYETETCGLKIVRKVCWEGRYLALYLLLKYLDPSQRANLRHFHIGTIDIN